MSGGERAAIEAIRRILSESAPPGEVWIGDDAAVLRVPGAQLVASTDAVVGGVHADLDLVGLDDLGWKALATAISDIAAMGARPTHCLVSVTGPPDTDLVELYRGIAQASQRWSCPVVGGDLVSAALLVVSVSVLGVIPGGQRAVLRSGARPGDSIFVTGGLGASAAGLAWLRSRRSGVSGAGGDTGAGGGVGERLACAHRRPLARVAEGHAAAAGGATAMIDVSDGLATDLTQLALASSVGFELEDVPVAEGASEAEALGGGEDYELVFTAAGAGVAAAFAAAGLRPPQRIGRCVADPSLRRLRGQQLGRLGWEHEWG